ncbi:MAG: AbgT family transporter [Bacteroidales bacterium]|jgi:aminobenzoyl-glutamate transport protein|nr:AbgT family transporter [Bacteroidales bacterium]
MTKTKGIFNRFLNITEKAGNALPHPATLFAIFALIVLIFSGVAHWFDVEAIHPATKEVIKPINLLSKDGLHRIMLHIVDNFTGFAPLGIVLVAMLGIGIAESSGLIGASIRLIVISAPKKYLTFVLVFAGILSNMASDVGYVLLIPLAGVIFLAVGRHPIAGMAAAFAGVSGGFSANLILGTIDPLLAGLSEEAAQILDKDYVVNPTANYYFMVASTFIIAFAGTIITEKIIEPRLGKYKGDVEPDKMEKLTPIEKKGLIWASIGGLTLLAISLLGLIPSDGFLRAADGTVLKSPFIKGIIFVLVMFTMIPGLIYGFITKKFKNDADVMKGMAGSMKTLASYIVLVFFAAQFVAFFKWSNLGIILAIKGANALMAADMNIIVLIILFILLAGIINLAMGSASAKWAIMAPIFIPMFMLMGYSPELSQVVYRIGDSVTNIISPMMSFFALIIAYFQNYDKKAGIGTIVATMLPYTFAFFILWTVLIMIWVWFGLPLGPGVDMYYQVK